MQTLKVLRTADFAPLMVFIAPTNAAAEVLNLIIQANAFKKPTSDSCSPNVLLFVC